MLKRLLCALLCAVMLLSCLPVLAEETEYRTLKSGMKGEDILAMKARLHELGYIRTSNNHNRYTDEIAKIVRRFQVCNGMEATGVMTPEDQAVLYSENALPYHEVTPSPSPSPTPAPTPTPPPVIEYPERDEDGYMIGDGEYIYDNEDAGKWIYLSKDLQVYVDFYSQPEIPLEWFEAEIFCRGDVRFETAETNAKRPGTRFSYPLDISKEHHFVLGLTDDFYGYRLNKKKQAGMVVREGVITSKKTYRSRTSSIPNLDVLAQFPDGSFKTYNNNEITAEELLEAGAINSFSFGPILVRNGEIDPIVYEAVNNKYPRNAIGMVEPGHYVVLSVKGRIKSSEGAGMQWLAERMKAMGVTEALNLDGGNTSALIFCGKVLTRLGSTNPNSGARAVSSLLGIGYTETQFEY